MFLCVLSVPPQPPGGSSNLWDLVSVINGQDDSLLPATYSKGVMHMKHLLKFKTVSHSWKCVTCVKGHMIHTVPRTWAHSLCTVA